MAYLNSTTALLEQYAAESAADAPASVADTVCLAAGAWLSAAGMEDTALYKLMSADDLGKAPDVLIANLR
jgi:hypothetical protein